MRPQNYQLVRSANSTTCSVSHEEKVKQVYGYDILNYMTPNKRKPICLDTVHSTATAAILHYVRVRFAPALVLAMGEVLGGDWTFSLDSPHFEKPLQSESMHRSRLVVFFVRLNNASNVLARKVHDTSHCAHE